MKKLSIFFFLVLLLPLSGHSARIISPFEIARWYLDADLVIICSVQKTDTMLISRFDSLKADGFRIQYDLIKEKYHITIDSVLKSSSAAQDLPETVMTPDFPVNEQECRITEKIFTGLDGNGDSVFTNQIECKGVSYDDTWFRMGEKRYVVILRRTEAGYVIDYAQVCEKHILQLLGDVEKYRESFFPSIRSEN